MKQLEKEQVAFGLLKGIESEKWYAKWFTIYINENFKDQSDRDAWNIDLQKAIDVYDTNKQKQIEFEEMKKKMFPSYEDLSDEDKLEQDKKIAARQELFEDFLKMTIENKLRK